MGNDYDPTEYGMVDLKRSGSAASGPGSGGGSPEDILFESVAPATPSPETTGFPAPESTDGGFSETSETDVPHPDTTASGTAARDTDQDDDWAALEEQLADREPKPASPPPKPSSSSKAKALPKTKSSGPRARLTARPPKIHHYRPPPRPSSWFVPIAVASLGLGTGAFLYLVYHNIPLGGLAAALGLTGACFTRVLLRAR